MKNKKNYRCDVCKTKLKARKLPEGVWGAGKKEYFCSTCKIGFTPEAAEAFCSSEARSNQSNINNFIESERRRI